MKTTTEFFAAYTKLETQRRVRLRNAGKQSLADVREALPETSQLAGYLDDFLPGGPSQYLDAELARENDGGWKLSIWVDTADAEGVQYYDAAGNFLRWGA